MAAFWKVNKQVIKTLSDKDDKWQKCDMNTGVAGIHFGFEIICTLLRAS